MKLAHLRKVRIKAVRLNKTRIIQATICLLLMLSMIIGLVPNGVAANTTMVVPNGTPVVQVTDWTGLQAAIVGAAGASVDIHVMNNITAGSTISIPTGVHVFLRSNPLADEIFSIYQDTLNQHHFVVSGGTLYMGNISLTRTSPAVNFDSPVGGGIVVSGARLEMFEGTVISGNSNGWELGGGIQVQEQSTVIMHDGEISGNVGFLGGGISVGWSNPSTATFTMHRGIIKDNMAWGGGGIFALYYTNITIGEAALFTGNVAYDPSTPQYMPFDWHLSPSFLLNPLYVPVAESNMGLGGSVANINGGSTSIAGTHLLNNFDVNFAFMNESTGEYYGIINTQRVTFNPNGGVFTGTNQLPTRLISLEEIGPAPFSAPTYALAFDENGNLRNLPLAHPTRTNYTFAGWFDSEANANGTTQEGRVLHTDDVTNDENRTLYARWTRTVFQAEATLTKILESPVGTTLPDDLSFDFVFAPVSQRLSDSPVVDSVPVASVPTILTQAVDIDMSTLSVTGNTQTVTGEIDIAALISSLNFTVPGVHVWNVYEEEGSSLTVSPSYLNYDTARFQIRVHVDRHLDVAILEFLTLDHVAGNWVPGVKIDEIEFTNSFRTRTTTQDANLLEVKKTVIGDFANTSELFDFDIILTGHTLAPVPATINAIIIGADGLPVPVPRGEVTITNGIGTFQLAHGERLSIPNVYAGTTAVVTEAAAPNFVASYQVVSGGAPGASDANEDPNTALTSSPVLVADTGRNAVDFTNDQNWSPPTGLWMNTMSWLAFLGLLALVMVLASRRRRAIESIPVF